VATILFKLIVPEKVLFSGDVRAVMLPATEGDITVKAERTLTPDATRDDRAHRKADFAPSRLEQVRITLSF
jgi:ATP synthase, Delta/Epsilon chain, beta-sandwich domain